MTTYLPNIYPSTSGLELARVPRVPGTCRNSEHHLWHPRILRFLILSGTRTHCANRYERYQLQYRFVNPLESVKNNCPNSISIMILRPHGRPFEKIDIKNEAFAL